MGNAVCDENFFTEKPPCCLEFCPTLKEYVVVGTYDLNQNDETQNVQHRDGSIILLKITDSIQHVQTIATASAILDIHFAPKQAQEATTIFGAVTSTGTFLRLQLVTGDTHPTIVLLNTLQLFEPSILITSFAWNPSQIDRVLCTLTSGQLVEAAIGSPAESFGPSETTVICTHSLQAWIACYIGSTSTLSGGDDAVVQYCSLDGTSQAWRDTKIHGAGVTAIMPLSSDLMLTGSYDDRLRILQMPAYPMTRPVVLAEHNLGGGVWRLAKIRSVDHPRRRIELLISCMYEGVCVVVVDESADGSWSINEKTWFKEHKSMCYASALVPSGADLDCNAAYEYRCISSSFYDKRLCLWRPNPST